jgi:hypothetical protein
MRAGIRHQAKIEKLPAYQRVTNDDAGSEGEREVDTSVICPTVLRQRWRIYILILNKVIPNRAFRY